MGLRLHWSRFHNNAFLNKIYFCLMTLHGSSFDEDELVRLLKSGNSKAFEEIYNHFFDRLYVVAFNRTKSKEVAEDIVHNIFVKLWLRRETVVIEGSLKAYLGVAVKYEVFNYFRDKVSWQQHQQKFKQSQPTFYNCTEDQLNAALFEQALRNSINNLPDKCRLVFQMSREEHLTFPEIAQKLNISQKTVEFHISKSLRILKISLRDFLPYLLLFLFLL